jgi:hypothetical protein
MRAKKSKDSPAMEQVKALQYWLELIKDPAISEKLAFISKHYNSLLAH